MTVTSPGQTRSLSSPIAILLTYLSPSYRPASASDTAYDCLIWLMVYEFRDEYIFLAPYDQKFRLEDERWIYLEVHSY